MSYHAHREKNSDENNTVRHYGADSNTDSKAKLLYYTVLH